MSAEADNCLSVNMLEHNMYKEILVYCTGNTALRMSDYAAHFALALKTRLAGFVVDVDFIDYSTIDNAITGFQNASAVETLLLARSKSHANTLRFGALFENKAREHNVSYDIFYKKCVPADIPHAVAELTRLYDCALLPSVEEVAGFQIPIVEAVLFGSGRPVIVIPADQDLVFSLGHVVVAWDGSGPASRAVHDALPILHTAATVDVLTIANEKPLDRVATGQDLVRHLKVHGVNARYGSVQFKGEPVGSEIMTEALQRGAKLLIMGAYGHSRVKQIMFGGATKTVLEGPRLPVLLSH